MDSGTNPARTVAMLFMIPVFSITPRNTPAHKIVEDIMIAGPAWDLMILFCKDAPWKFTSSAIAQPIINT